MEQLLRVPEEAEEVAAAKPQHPFSLAPCRTPARAVCPINLVSLHSPSPSLLPCGFFSPRALTDYSSSPGAAWLLGSGWRLILLLCHWTPNSIKYPPALSTQEVLFQYCSLLAVSILNLQSLGRLCTAQQTWGFLLLTLFIFCCWMPNKNCLPSPRQSLS